MNLIEFRNASFSRGSRLALDAVSFSVRLGEHLAILGPNGSGKSTLIKAITRECYPRWSPDGPSVRILGRDTWNVFELRCLLGIVSSDLAETCVRGLTARDVVLSGFFSSIGLPPGAVVTPAMETKAAQVLYRLEIAHLDGRPMTEMSSGETRRVVLGRALVHDPRALVLDEPTTSLDLRATHELRAILRKLAASGITIVMVTHHLGDILPEIGRLILLRNGRVLCDGPKKELLSSAALAEVFGQPVEVLEKDGFYHAW